MGKEEAVRANEEPEDLSETSFGEVLKRFRQRQRLSQGQLAQRAETHRNSISLWEQDSHRPTSPLTVDLLANALELNEGDRRLLFEACFGSGSLVPVYHVPFDPNPYFTGREKDLLQLHDHLQNKKRVALTQAISGLGGIGKTQLAREYVHHFRESYHDILWAGAASEETLISEYLHLASLLHLPEHDGSDQDKVVMAVKRWLGEHQGWLLVLDNVEDLDLVKAFVPPGRKGMVLLTTRRSVSEPIAESQRLTCLAEEEGALLLLRRTRYLSRAEPLSTASASEQELALAISYTLGGLPLALDQAGAYILETGCGLSDYLDLFQRHQQALLQRRSGVPSEHPQSVAATFALAFKQLQQRNEAAIELLTVCAFLAPDSIPLELLRQGAMHLGRVLAPVLADMFLLDLALEMLQAYSFVQRDRENRSLSIHRLVQAVLQDTLGEEERHIWKERVALAVYAAFPHAQYETWSQCERMLSQALFATQVIMQEQMRSQEAGRLLYETASYLQDRARYAEAETLYLHALHLWEQLGVEHPQMARLLNYLALLYQQQGKHAEAEPLLLRELRIREQLGREHPDVVHPLNSLASLYSRLGKYAEAEPLLLRALHIWEQLGVEHFDVERSLSWTLIGLASLYSRLGKYVEAEPLLLRALHIWEQHLGPEHPEVAIPLNNLAEIYSRLDKYAEAEQLYLQALHIWEQQLGSEHPNVAHTLNGLADLYREQGKYEQAEPFYQRALRLREQQLGSDHYLTQQVRSNYTLLLRAMKRETEARKREKDF